MELKENEKLIKEYDKFYLIEVKCDNGNTYKTTKDKFIPTNKVPKLKTNRSTYKHLGFCEGGIYGR